MKFRRRELSIKQKLILFFLVFFCTPFLIISWIWYAKSTETIESNAIYYNQAYIGQLNGRFEEYFERMKVETQTLPGYSLIQEFVTVDPDNSYELFQLKERISRDLYPSIAYRNKELVGFFMYSVKGAMLGDASVGEWSQPFRDSDDHEEGFKVVGIQQVRGVPVVLLNRNIYDTVTYKFAGSIVFAFSLEHILNLNDSTAFGKPRNIAIADETFRFLYHPAAGKWGALVPEAWTSSMTGQNGYFVDRTAQGKQIVVYSESEFTGLTMISEVPLDELVGNFSQLRTATIVIGVVVLLLASLTFNKMLLEIKRLVEVIHTSRLKHKEMELRQREAMFQALQSQINPHFLYNSLEIINSYAILAKAKPISQMTVQLANMFRYSVSDPQSVVPLRDEIGHIRNYLRILEERYENLRVEIRLDEADLDQVALYRLTLQPIIENAIYHAYEKNGLHPGSLSVAGMRRESLFSLQVEDRGIGMDPQLMARYNDAFEAITEQEVPVSARPFPGIGLWNVHSRLRLAFGSPYGLHIVRSGREGTLLEIRLPYPVHPNK
jgi:two-component system sensor histidine kinase YesM